MRVLFLSRSTLFSQPGGDTLQVEQTAEHLRQLGCHVDVKLGPQKNEYHNYDVIHFFNLVRPADARKVLKSNKPLIVSSIYHDYNEYDSRHRGALFAWLYRLFGKFSIEYFKTIARWLNGSDEFPGFAYLIQGQKRSMQKILKHSQFLLATSHQEIKRITDDLGHLPPSKKVSLGSEHIPLPKTHLARKGVLCAARIEGPKNQLKLIRAVNAIGVALHLTGNTAKNQSDYTLRCRKEASAHVHFHGRISKEELTELYQQSKVHALISYYETTGLSTLEALKMGCQVVVTNRGAQPEIFGPRAFYCDPDNLDSIKAAVEEALTCNENHTEWVKDNFSWAAAARDILDIYHTLTETSS
jgi:glycosyltransferase involved in cell wall biosynthesis